VRKAGIRKPAPGLKRVNDAGVLTFSLRLRAIAQLKSEQLFILFWFEGTFRLSMDAITVHPQNAPLTVSDHLAQILPRTLATKTPDMPLWPADVFAVAASLLQRTGTYAAAMDHWPPDGHEDMWIDEVRNAGKEWRRLWQVAPLGYLQAAWNELLSKRAVPLEEIAQDTKLLQSLIAMCAVADESCSRIGILDEDAATLLEKDDEAEFVVTAEELLQRNSSLCFEIHPSRLRVLPKMHTPQSGLTIRSFSLNLALVTTSEITPNWVTYPSPFGKKPMQILFVPWPYRVEADDFRPSPRLPGEMRNMPREFDFFEYTPTARGDLIGTVYTLLEQAAVQGVEINAVLLPELAVSDAEFEDLSRLVVEDRKMVLIAGVSTPHQTDARCKNEARLAIPYYDTLAQAKHHRWKLDRNQIEQYDLTALDPERSWWEHIDLSSREFMFVSMGRGRVISVLICEDLARPDPVGDLIRAVGPNLVIALLMDGPQLKGRWPARYAASLASDPGSSVLSVTSIGMSARSKPKGPMPDRRNVVGLWHSADGDFRELELPAGSQALLLTLERTYVKEWTGDGRDDNSSAGIIRLTKCEGFPGA
jgi:hypothetical protein